MGLSLFRLGAFAVVLSIFALASAQDGSISVQVDRPAIKISPTFYGLMTEEINHAYDGGLYAELIRNRAFRDSKTEPVHWSLTGSGGQISLEHLGADSPWTDALTLTTQGQAGVANDGFWGIPVKPHTAYKATFYAKGSITGPVTLSIETADGATTYAKAEVQGLGSEWKKFTATLRTGDTAASKNNRFLISTSSPGTISLSYVSLMPPTFHRRANGNRPDLMEELGELNPSFLRLPGGNYLEGNTIEERFNWKATIGDPAMRLGHQCPWGYRSSDGLGLLEYLEWCEDLKMQPVLAVFAGYALRGEHVNPGPDLEPYVQDALDEIEYATGDTSTKWGAERAKNGHPKPFPLTYVEIGNEDWFDRSRTYDGRFAQFYDAIKAKYPGLQIIATAPIQSRKPDVMDDHYYRSAADMERDSGHYDRISRSGPKIFVGEWASIEGSPTPTMDAALGDAAWLTGLERNSDLVVMESYAPLFVNVNPGAAQWGTNLIGYDALTSYGSPSFYVQSMFGKNTGDVELPAKLEIVKPPAEPVVLHGAIGIGTWRTQSEYKEIRVTFADGSPDFVPSTSSLDGWTRARGQWSVVDGALRQTGNGTGTLLTIGDPKWTNYTIHLKARKIGGAEGFMVMGHVLDPRNHWQWNVGGWDDSQSAIQRTEGGSSDIVGPESRATVETNRWYDLALEVKDGKIRGYLDGKLINEATETSRPPADPVYVAASKVSSSGEVILKVVNVSEKPMSLSIALNGAGDLEDQGSGWVLTGQPGDVNSIEQPEKVKPKPIHVDHVGSNFTRSFDAHSVTVLRFKTKR
ncbi:MAG TPA: alpha-L-arabinofuranosidase C-terminal domain-containing protein [Fimbriimonas sp.]|nr:alpha-L-arabinofuranosidase C-terminal domain-containing protein [Fimbriimonas sp.]